MNALSDSSGDRSGPRCTPFSVRVSFFFCYWSPSEQGSAIEMQAFQVAWTEKAGTLPRARGQHVNQGHPFAVDDRRPPLPTRAARLPAV